MIELALLFTTVYPAFCKWAEGLRRLLVAGSPTAAMSVIIINLSFNVGLKVLAPSP